MTLQLVSGLSLWQSTAQDHYSSQILCVLIYATEEILSLDISREVSVSFTWTIEPDFIHYDTAMTSSKDRFLTEGFWLIKVGSVKFLRSSFYWWCLSTSNRIVIQLLQSCIFLSVTCNLMLIWFGVSIIDVHSQMRICPFDYLVFHGKRGNVV